MAKTTPVANNAHPDLLGKLTEDSNDGFDISEIVFLKLVNFVESILEGLVSKIAGGLVVLYGGDEYTDSIMERSVSLI